MNPFTMFLLVASNIILFIMLGSMTYHDYKQRHDIGSGSYKAGIAIMLFVLFLDFITIIV